MRDITKRQDMSKNSTTNDQQISLIGRYMMFGMWIGLLSLLTWFFYDWQQNDFNPNQTIPSMTNKNGQNELVLQANRQGQYIANGYINGTSVVFLLDTGANDVSIPAHIAKKIKLPQGRKIQFETANGIASGFKTKINKIKIGDIELQNINASINPNVRFDEILLGMSFLKHVELVQKNKTMTLRY